jgi:hypothetical protein
LAERCERCSGRPSEKYLLAPHRPLGGGIYSLSGRNAIRHDAWRATLRASARIHFTHDLRKRAVGTVSDGGLHEPTSRSALEQRIEERRCARAPEGADSASVGSIRPA